VGEDPTSLIQDPPLRDRRLSARMDHAPLGPQFTRPNRQVAPVGRLLSFSPTYSGEEAIKTSPSNNMTANGT